MTDWEEVFKFIEENKIIMTWQEIADNLNTKFNNKYTESAYRKPYQAFIKGVEFSNKLSADEEMLERVGNARVKLKLERKLVEKERYIVNTTINKIATFELFSNEVLESIKKGYPNIDKIILDKKDKSDEYYMVNIADIHYKGYENLEMMFSEFLSLILHKQKEFGFKELLLSENGDTVEGATLRTSQLLAIKKGLIDQTLDVAKAYSNFLTELTKSMKVTFVCVEESNHTQLRNLGTGRDELPAEDTMKVIAEFIKARCETNPNLTIITAPEVILPYKGKLFGFVHGHKKTKSGYMEKFSAHNGINLDYLVSAHFHHGHIETISKANGYNREFIELPSACLEQSSYEKNGMMSSMPSILFSKFNKNGRKYSEELILEKSLALLERKDKIKKKVS